ncbi:MAG TPA: hypothetical protein VGC56_08030 [Allosphingosinicella sp.]
MAVKVVIYGSAKSGTSALFYKIKNSLPAGTIALFEPRTYTLIDRAVGRLRALRHGNATPDVLAKVLPWDMGPVRVADFETFDRQILIVRDPRDRIVSDLLYRSYNARFVHDGSAALALLRLLERKEAEPRSVPLMEIVQAFDALEHAAGAHASWRERYAERGIARPLRFHDARPDLHLFRYEQLVDGEFDDLEAMLRLPLAGSADLPHLLQRVERTKSYGTWRSWFTPADVDIFRPILQPFLDRYYPRAGWDLDDVPQLAPRYGSRYVASVINERRALSRLPPLPDR